MCVCAHAGRGDEIGKGRRGAGREGHGTGERFLVKVQYMSENKRVVGRSESSSSALGLTPWDKQGDAAL